MGLISGCVSSAGVHPGRLLGGWVQPYLTSGGKVPSTRLEVEIVKSVSTAVETEAQRD